TARGNLCLGLLHRFLGALLGRGPDFVLIERVNRRDLFLEIGTQLGRALHGFGLRHLRVGPDDLHQHLDVARRHWTTGAQLRAEPRQVAHAAPPFAASHTAFRLMPQRAIASISSMTRLRSFSCRLATTAAGSTRLSSSATRRRARRSNSSGARLAGEGATWGFSWSMKSARRAWRYRAFSAPAGSSPSAGFAFAPRWSPPALA